VKGNVTEKLSTKKKLVELQLEHCTAKDRSSQNGNETALADF
jgi:hypothetical protein